MSVKTIGFNGWWKGLEELKYGTHIWKNIWRNSCRPIEERSPDALATGTSQQGMCWVQDS